MFGILIAVAAIVGATYAVKHHITVAQAKASAEALIAKVKAEVVVVEADAVTVVAKIKTLLSLVK